MAAGLTSVGATGRGWRPARRRFATALGWICLNALALGACRADVDTAQPPEIRYGEDVCDQCGMIIDDERFAAALWVTVAGRREPRRFDDLDDLLAYAAAHPEQEVERWWVHDYDSGEWLDGEQAIYVRQAAVRSPMGHGLLAFKDQAAAERFVADQGGETLRLTDLLSPGGIRTPPGP